MAQYLSSECLRGAVERLGQSRANSTLLDYLIFRRALQLKKDGRTDGAKADAVETGLGAEPFQEAIQELASADRGASGTWAGAPFFSPFGATRDRTYGGFKSQKYPSNGPSDTVGRWQSRASTPLKLVPDTKPKAYELSPATPSDAAKILISGKTDLALPSLADVAMWWLRGQDLEHFGLQSPLDWCPYSGVGK